MDKHRLPQALRVVKDELSSLKGSGAKDGGAAASPEIGSEAAPSTLEELQTLRNQLAEAHAALEKVTVEKAEIAEGAKKLQTKLNTTRLRSEVRRQAGSRERRCLRRIRDAMRGRTVSPGWLVP